MEWKPKSINVNLVQGSGAAGTSEISSVSAESGALMQPVSGVLDSEEANPKPQKKLEELHSRARRHVIIPNHIHVPEAERTGLSFGSFTTGFGVSLVDVYDPESDKSSTPHSETSQGIGETVEEQSSRSQKTKDFFLFQVAFDSVMSILVHLFSSLSLFIIAVNQVCTVTINMGRFHVCSFM